MAIDRGTRVATCTTRRYMDSPDGRCCQVWQGSARCVCEGRGTALDPHTPTSTPAPHVPATPSEKDQGKKKYGSATLRGQSGLPAPVTAAHPQRKRPVAFPLQWLGRVVDCLVRQRRCDSVAVRARHWLLHLKCGWRLPPCSRFFHAPVPRLI